MTAMVALFIVTFGVVLSTVAADPDMLQDVCVADLASGTLCFSLFFFFDIITFFLTPNFNLSL